MLVVPLAKVPVGPRYSHNIRVEVFPPRQWAGALGGRTNAPSSAPGSRQVPR